MTINKSQLGNKRVALNTLADAIDTNIEAAATVTVADAGNLYAGTNVEACLAEIAGTGRTNETVKSVDTLIDDHIADTTAAHAATAISVGATTITATEVDAAFDELAGTGRTTETVKDNADNLDDLERSGSTVEVGGAATDASRSVTLTLKDGADVAVAGYQIVGVKVTNGDGAGADTGTPAVIANDLDTTDGLVVGASGEQISPSNGAAISDTKNASLLAFTKSDGTLEVTLNKDSENDFFFVHFLLPDGSVVSSDEIELNNAG